MFNAFKMIVNTFRVFVCSASFLYTCYVLCNFMYFLSSHTNQQNEVHIPKDKNTLLTVLSIIIFDAALLSIFIMQHSVMATSLHFLITKWKSIPWMSLWNIDTNYYSHMWSVMISVHILAWFIIYSGCVMMDLPELAGIKQVYYHLSGRPSAMVLKSIELRRFLGHMRHPSFTGFLIIFWVHPVMSIDRFLIATLMTIYMLAMWNIDKNDFSYHMEKIQRKKMGLSLN